MGWVPDNVLERMASSHLLGIFVRLDIDPPLRLWLGINDVPAGIESRSETGETYFGAGRLQGVPQLEVLINGIADRVEFQLAGVRPEDAARLDIDSYAIRGAEVDVGITTLDDYYEPMTAIIPLWQGQASFVREKSPPVPQGEQRVVTLSLSVGSGITTRDRASASIWSHAHQRALYPTDDFCKGTARLARGHAPAWPRF